MVLASTRTGLYFTLLSFTRGSKEHHAPNHKLSRDNTLGGSYYVSLQKDKPIRLGLGSPSRMISHERCLHPTPRSNGYCS